MIVQRILEGFDMYECRIHSSTLQRYHYLGRHNYYTEESHRNEKQTLFSTYLVWPGREPLGFLQTLGLLTKTFARLALSYRRPRVRHAVLIPLPRQLCITKHLK